MESPVFKLVYHPVPPEAESLAFAEELKTIVDGSRSVDIASPYVSLGVLQHLVSAAEKFRVVTDLDELLGTSREVVALGAWLRDCAGSVRSIPGLHAKVVLGDEAGMLGSANLTQTAISRRFEMGAVVRGGPLAELRTWFDALWHHAVAPSGEMIERAIRPRTEDSAPGTGESLPPTGKLGWLDATFASPPGYRSAREPVTVRRAEPDVAPEILSELADVMRRTTSPESIHSVVRLFRDALDVIAVPPDDERLHLNFKGARWSITLGGRHVIWAKIKRRVATLGLLLDTVDVAREATQGVVGAEVFEFTHRGRPMFPGVYWPTERVEQIPEAMRADWLRGIVRQRDLSGPSPYLRAKRAELYTVLRSETLTQQVVQLAHPVAGQR